jgi:hypothetical protein
MIADASDVTSEWFRACAFVCRRIAATDSTGGRTERMTGTTVGMIVKIVVKIVGNVVTAVPVTTNVKRQRIIKLRSNLTLSHALAARSCEDQ